MNSEQMVTEERLQQEPLVDTKPSEVEVLSDGDTLEDVRQRYLHTQCALCKLPCRCATRSLTGP